MQEALLTLRNNYIVVPGYATVTKTQRWESPLHMYTWPGGGYQIVKQINPPTCLRATWAKLSLLFFIWSKYST